MRRKKLLMGAVTAALALTVLTTGALAGWHHGRSGGTGSSGNGGAGVCVNTACGYVDADGDGICDNRGTGACRYVDANGDGVCDNCAAVVVRTCGGCGLGYVDRNGDGICDNCSGICQTAGGGHHHRQGRHH